MSGDVPRGRWRGAPEEGLVMGNRKGTKNATREEK